MNATEIPITLVELDKGAAITPKKVRQIRELFDDPRETCDTTRYGCVVVCNDESFGELLKLTSSLARAFDCHFKRVENEYARRNRS